jgi:hypothetical protein
MGAAVDEAATQLARLWRRLIEWPSQSRSTAARLLSILPTAARGRAAVPAVSEWELYSFGIETVLFVNGICAYARLARTRLGHM